ncbi:MAG TPA: hypothetical protein VGX25_01480 [Actinophytocola sp.]|uniref:hypothetical protein n=1 Tax=Actinophytocola sp. TaxID=1872138 RepID=UPI002DDC990B|nr:hypothetical protein [Actinophytocola sp.]HEV2778048.1 hypothetical protein [Actinophytocola sp.]
MSQPRDPYRRGPAPPYRQYGQPAPYQQQYGQPAPYQQPPRRPAALREPPAPSRAPRRIPGLGLILTLLGVIIQVLSFTVLPWIMVDANQPVSISLPTLWDGATELGTHGFGAWYVVLFSYPLAALGIVLALATVLDSVVLKVIWGGLMIVGLGVLVLRYGFGPVADLVVTDDEELRFTTQEITTAVIAVAALVVVIFVLRTAMSMFRRVAALILLGLAGVHVAAVVDLVRDSSGELGIGAFGPAAGYVLIAVAAIVGPRRIPGV